MHPGILSCHTDMPLTEVARMMTAHRVHCIAVMAVSHSHPSEPMVYGIISDRDLVRAGLRTGDDETAGALAQQPVITVKPSTPLRQAGRADVDPRGRPPRGLNPETQIPIGVLFHLRPDRDARLQRHPEMAQRMSSAEPSKPTGTPRRVTKG